MFRIMSIATLIMIAICFFVGASLAMADERVIDVHAGPAEEQINDATRPVESLHEENLAERDQDRYDFTDYLNGSVTVPTVDAESIEEPEIDRSPAQEV
jgi:hypothetical protein